MNISCHLAAAGFLAGAGTGSSGSISAGSPGSGHQPPFGQWIRFSNAPTPDIDAVEKPKKR
jgi:hypothetical protein